jgi:F0F1-type ATP synthase assembly protein I
MKTASLIAAGILIALAVFLYLYTTHTSLSFVPAPANATLNQATAVIGSNLTAGINTTQNLVRAGVSSIAGKLG